MSTRLETLFEQYQFSPKDTYDFMQIYNLLPDYKKVRVMDQFASIADKIYELKYELHSQQEILFGMAIKNIEETLSEVKKGNILSWTKQEISVLKGMI